MFKLGFNDLMYFCAGPVDWCHPRACKNINLRVWVRNLKLSQKRLRHDCITNPIWGNNQNTLHMVYPDAAPQQLECRKDLMTVWLGARNEFVLSAAIWTLSLARGFNIQEYAWMWIPAGSSVSGAVQWQILAINHHNLSISHFLVPKLLYVSKPRFIFIASSVNSIKISLLNFFGNWSALTIANSAII